MIVREYLWREEAEHSHYPLPAGLALIVIALLSLGLWGMIWVLFSALAEMLR
jgi:uncharacterized membrane protein